MQKYVLIWRNKETSETGFVSVMQGEKFESTFSVRDALCFPYEKEAKKALRILSGSRHNKKIDFQYVEYLE